jgi:hypothetical protein
LTGADLRRGVVRGWQSLHAAFIARDMGIAAHEMEPDLGSDHLPVVVTLTLR